MKQAVAKKIGPFKTLMYEGRAGGPCVVLFHGYGADASDLMPLVDMMGVAKDVTWVFPEGPLQVILGPGMTGKAWYQIDSKILEQGMRSGKPADLSEIRTDGLLGIKKNVATFYSELAQHYNKIIVGGFSQGAMLATDLALTNDKKPAGLVIMSGTLVNQKVWREAVTSCDGLSFIQSHGKNDALLGYEYAENLYEILTSGGLLGDFVNFNGGHEIPPKVIEKIGSYISSTLR